MVWEISHFQATYMLLYGDNVTDHNAVKARAVWVLQVLMESMLVGGQRFTVVGWGQ